MELHRTEPLALIGAVIGAAVLSAQSLGYGVGAVGDIAILLALFTFDSMAIRSGAQSLALAASESFCLLTPFQLLANALSQTAPAYWMMTAVWVAGTALLFSLDRFRMSCRESVSLAGAGLAGPVQPIAMTPLQTPTFRPAPIRVESVPVPVVAPLTAVEPLPTNVSDPVGPPIDYDVTAVPTGREALIYLNLVGEGLNVLRTVRAENLGRDYYRIADIMPEGEQWEFTPGQVVRCRKKSLSNGKHMVAYEEAPRAQ